MIPDTWDLTPDDWHAITWYRYIWPDVVTPDWILLHLTPILHCMFMIITLRGLDMIIILLPDIWYSYTPGLLYSWTHVSPVLISPALLLLLIARSYWRPTEHAWCRDDEDVSHDHASVWRILNGTKCHTEQSTTPHTWWGPPLESIPHTELSVTQRKVPHHTRGGGHLLNLWGPPLEYVGLPPEFILQEK